MTGPSASPPMHSRTARAASPARARCARLLVEGLATALRVRRADGFLARAIGLLRAPPAGSACVGSASAAIDRAPVAEVLLIPRCAAVHTFGMRRPIDVAFVDRGQRVVRAVAPLRPWRIAWCRGADATWEFPAGELARLHIVPGMRLGAATRGVAASLPIGSLSPGHAPPRAAADRGAAARTRRPHRERGAAMLEFLVAAVLVLLPLTFATLELAQLAVARHALDYASFEAARSGAVHGADRAAMRRALARALVPLFAPVDPLAVLRAGAAAGGAGVVQGGEQAAVAAFVRAAAEVLRPDLMRLEIENPTIAAGRDFGIVEAGERVIPNDGLDQRNPSGPQSGQTLREANVLAIRVRYCRRLFMPIVDRVVPAVLRLRLLDPFDQLCLAQGRVPIEARSVVHMQSPTRVAQLDGG